MVYLFIFLGVVFIGLAVWSGRVTEIRRQQEVQEFRRLHEDLKLARNDVEKLLDQLETVSEKVVADISASIEEAETLKDLKIYEDSEEDSGETVKVKSVPEEAHSGPAPDTAEQDNKTEKANNTEKSSNNGLNKTKATGKNNTILFPRSSVPQGGEQEGTSRSDSKPKEIPAKHQMVYAMERLGYPEDEIARQMNIGKGEVSLILQIKRKGEELNA